MIALCCVFIFPTLWIVWQCRPPPFFPILEFPPAHVSISADNICYRGTVHFNILPIVSYFGYFTCRQYLQPFISTSYQLFHILDILLADNICYRSFQHPTNCFIFWIFYLPTIFATVHFNILPIVSYFGYFTCRQYLQPIISTSTNCFIFWIFYLPTIFATLCNHVSHIFEILLADNICYRSL
jgi:hypothetical protein